MTEKSTNKHIISIFEYKRLKYLYRPIPHRAAREPRLLFLDFFHLNFLKFYIIIFIFFIYL